MYVLKNNSIVLKGYRNFSDGLWDVPLPQQQQQKLSHISRGLHHTNISSITFSHFPTVHKLNVIIRKDKTKHDLIRYLHACSFSPPITTFLKAVKNGNFVTWPGITEQLIKKYLTPSIATAKGHLDQERKNVQSTKNNENEIDLDFFPPSDIPNQKVNEICAALMPFTPQEKGYADLTGRFPYRSTRGNQYFLVICDYDSNAILAETLKNRTAGEIKRGFMLLNNILAKRGCQPKLYVLDNEASNELKNGLIKHKIEYQLVPPHLHRRNAAERAIRTFKNHFLSGLATVNKNFPICEWDRLLPQALLTLNLLRNARANPQLSAWAYLNGIHDFNKCPLAPPGTRVVLHEKPAHRASWAYHGVDGWYVGPSFEHYRCVKVYIPDTGAVRDAGTVQFFPEVIPIPATSPEDYLKQAATDILSILKNPPPTLPY